jgi:hypothetical protein
MGRSMGRHRAIAAVMAGLVIAACSAGGVSGGSGPDEAGGASATGGKAGTAGKGGSAGNTGGSAGASAGGMSGGGGDTSSFGGGINLPDGGMPDVLPEGCSGVEQAANRIPLTVFVMLDRSPSIGTDLWAAARNGLKGFINDKASEDITVGLSFFPVDADQLKFEDCSFKNYQDPQVPLGKLPGNAKTLSDAIDAAKTGGFGTPMYPALGGALERGVATQSAKPGENFVVLLVTDGAPSKPPATCPGVDPIDPNVTADLVEKAYTQFNVRTFVVGLPGVSASFANLIAQKGGSDAIIITSSVDIEGQFQDALSKVRGESLGCEFPLPPDSSKYDKTLVNVRFTDGKGAATDLDHSADCSVGDGWKYDNETTPTKVVLCDSICKQAKTDGLAKIQIVLGCPTREVK